MTTLTDRYVAAVLRAVPDKSRAEIERELRASIADALDAHIGNGEDRELAETAVLTELGDPSLLAREYAGPPHYLIGPNVYHAYVRTLGTLLAVFLPLSWSLLLAIWLLGGNSLLEALATASGGALTVGLLVAFWTTLAYSVVDRSAEARQELAAAFGSAPGMWGPERLPSSTAMRPGRQRASIEAVVGGAIGIVLLFVQRSVSPFSDPAGQPIPILNPELWSFWLPALIAIAAALVVTEFTALAVGSWSPWLAVLITLIQLASATGYIYLLATGSLFNPAFFDRLGLAGWIAAGSLPVLGLILLSAVDTGTRVAKLWGVSTGRSR